MLGLPQFRTANAADDDAASLKAENEALKARLAKLDQEAQETNIKKALGLGDLLLPEGLDPKDVLWRKNSGLTLEQAVKAALAQKKRGEKDAAAAKAAEEAAAKAETKKGKKD